MWQGVYNVLKCMLLFGVLIILNTPCYPELIDFGFFFALCLSRRYHLPSCVIFPLFIYLFLLHHLKEVWVITLKSPQYFQFVILVKNAEKIYYFFLNAVFKTSPQCSPFCSNCLCVNFLNGTWMLPLKRKCLSRFVQLTRSNINTHILRHKLSTTSDHCTWWSQLIGN